MRITVKDLNNNNTSEVDLNESIFGLPKRVDIISRMVNYQLAKRRSGNHKTRGISEISGTTKKPFNQKGTGRARQGSLRSPHMRGGACIFGPLVRSHEIQLTKKFRRLALKIALSIKAQDGQLIVLDDLKLSEAKTKNLLAKLRILGIHSALFIDGNEVNDNFKFASSNIHYIDALPQQGINVYDIIRRETLILTKNALEHLEERLK